MNEYISIVNALTIYNCFRAKCPRSIITRLLLPRTNIIYYAACKSINVDGCKVRLPFVPWTTQVFYHESRRGGSGARPNPGSAMRVAARSTMGERTAWGRARSHIVTIFTHVDASRRSREVVACRTPLPYLRTRVHPVSLAANWISTRRRIRPRSVRAGKTSLYNTITITILSHFNQHSNNVTRLHVGWDFEFVHLGPFAIDIRL